ncbi:glycosyltransferase family 25 protein [Vibrio metschnikovii]|uniref:glycosyltransferase family 25 protein n=1 Tax=Vibrio metschnikovii TaxID=28172 RepID=UPI001C2F41B4|nr:glycosyltransferase family 25 protein [Vibrio metschnikovii]
MNIYVVSLTSSLTRRERITNQLNKAKIDFEFFDAINAHEPSFLYSEKANPSLTFKRKGYYLKPGEIACFASHYSLWLKCRQLNQPIVILEDNVDLADVTPNILATLLNEADHFHYIKLAATFVSPFTPIKTIDDTFAIGQYRKKSCGTTAYIISPQAAEQLIKQAHSFIEPVDDYLEKPWRHGIKTYSVFPALFHRAQVASTINSASVKRKEKKNLTLMHKVYVECYRALESVLRLLYWKHT